MAKEFQTQDTAVIHAGELEENIEGAITLPIFQSSTFLYEGQSRYEDLKYIRLNNTPNHTVLHGKLAALEGGEDYELCLTASPGTLQKWRGPFRETFGIPLTQIGRVVEGEGVFLERVGGEKQSMRREGFSHIREDDRG